ncbi:MAG: hypothetical protein II948_05425 [Synergistaceae bacterium]|nr:hypothetical protein [Synergistaceae bacterium]MBQ6908711.1 hypothetical protein [Synergistaceae bacterium]MBQ9580898.1 hypothetical protein [Synergistaceae bacterium]MBQ9896557.1 hypothetical protein [Synergistaceae bacterium]MBR0043253.1 hypothetical protein [Synergistaceae bacterium]
MTKVITVEELRGDLDKYLQMVDNGSEIILFNGGHKVGSIIPRGDPHDAVRALTGIFKSEGENYSDSDLEKAKDEYFREKYGLPE